MSRHILYIVNPISGTRKKKDLVSLIEKSTAKEGIPYSIFPSVADGNYEFLLDIIADKKVTDVVIAGGDGTVSQVIGSLLKLKLRFGIIPCGSGNGLAYSAGISTDPAKALQIIFKGHAELTDGYAVNNHFACMLCGLGFDARVAHDFAQQPKRGLTTYIKQVVKNFFSATTYTFDVKVLDKKFTTEAFFICVANSNQFGNNVTIAPKASLSDGLLDVVIVTHQNKLNLLLQTFRQVTGNVKLQPESAINTDKAVIYFQTDQLVIYNKSEAPMHIDGDPADTPSKLNVSVKSKCFNLLQPASR